jgi:UDPglucose--hexose-1-phosphate uridylyltransferase
MNGIGAHEVVVETPRHQETLATLPPNAVESVLLAYRARIIDLKRDLRLRYVMVFKNHGVAAGASLEHSHSQIIALPIVPRRVTEEIEGAKAYFNYKDRCVYCDIIRQELHLKIRYRHENQAFLSIAPFASRFLLRPGFSKAHFASFEQMDPSHYGLASW